MPRKGLRLPATDVFPFEQQGKFGNGSLIQSASMRAGAMLQIENPPVLLKSIAGYAPDPVGGRNAKD